MATGLFALGQPQQQKPQGLYQLGAPGQQRGMFQLGANIAQQQQDAANKPLDYSQAPALKGANDFSADRQNVQNSLGGYLNTRLDERFGREQQAFDQKMANQGVDIGSERYKQESQQFNDSRNRAYSDAQIEALKLGQGEQRNLFEMSLQGRQQGVSEADAKARAQAEGLSRAGQTAGQFGGYESAESMQGSGQAFQKDESALDRRQQEDLQRNQFGENTAQRGWQSGENTQQRNFERGQSGEDRAWKSNQSALDREVSREGNYANQRHIDNLISTLQRPQGTTTNPTPTPGGGNTNPGGGDTNTGGGGTGGAVDRAGYPTTDPRYGLPDWQPGGRFEGRERFAPSGKPWGTNPQTGAVYDTGNRGDRSHPNYEAPDPKKNG